jgi:hypothetical protein
LTTGSTRNTVFCVTPSGLFLRRPSGAFLLRQVLYFQSGVDSDQNGSETTLHGFLPEKEE